eukprot:2453226-Pyramimonas_sp.AAC.1
MMPLVFHPRAAQILRALRLIGAPWILLQLMAVMFSSPSAAPGAEFPQVDFVEYFAGETEVTRALWRRNKVARARWHVSRKCPTCAAQ